MPNYGTYYHSLIHIRLSQPCHLSILIQQSRPPSYGPRISHRRKPGIPLDPIERIQVLDTLPRKVLDVLPRHRILNTPIRTRKLGDPHGLVRPQLVVRTPQVVVKRAQLRPVPVETVEIHIRPPRPDLAQEVRQVPDGMRRRRDARAAAPDPLLAERLDAADPLGGGHVDGDVGLVGQLGLVEAQDGGGVGGAQVVGEFVDVHVVPLHGHELEGVGVGGAVRGPVVEPGDFGAGLGEVEGFVFAVVFGWPAEAALGRWCHCGGGEGGGLVSWYLLL